ncbi:MAG: hypothetical protein WD382_11550 [Halofilum sp. (in: g-proteobacteria)]
MQDDFHYGVPEESAAWLKRFHHMGRSLLRATQHLDSTAHCAALPRIPRHR